MSEFLNIFNNFATYILSYYSVCICCGSIFYPCFKFYFPLFLGTVMYDNEFKTKESKIQTKDRIEPQHIHHLSCMNVMKDKKTYPCHVTKSFLTCQREKKNSNINFDPNNRAQSCFCLPSHGLTNITNSVLKAWIEL